MASNPITSWQIEGEKVETVTYFIFLGSKITADGDCCHEIERRLLLGRKAMTNLNSILKSRDITLPTKVLLVTALVFPVVMYGCESWTIKKAEHWRIDTFNCGVGEDSWKFLGLQGDWTQVSCIAGGFLYQMSHQGSPHSFSYIGHYRILNRVPCAVQ